MTGRNSTSGQPRTSCAVSCPLPRLVVVADVGPGRLARWDVAEDQPHARPGFGLDRLAQSPVLQVPAAQPLTSAQPAQRPRNPRRCTPQASSWTMLRRPSRDIVRPSPALDSRSPGRIRGGIATDPTVASSRSRGVLRLRKHGGILWFRVRPGAMRPLGQIGEDHDSRSVPDPQGGRWLPAGRQPRIQGLMRSRPVMKRKLDRAPHSAWSGPS